MKHIVLIGNGFDLAHDLETRYDQFIDGFIYKSVNEGTKLFVTNDSFNRKEIYKCNIEDNLHVNLNRDRKYDISYTRNSEFFGKLIEYKKTSNPNWSNFEHILFELIKKNIKRDESVFNIINQDFKELERHLETYLSEQIENKIEDKIIRRDFSFEKTNIGNILFEHPGDRFEKSTMQNYSLQIINFNYTSALINHYLSKQYDSFGKDRLEAPPSLINVHGSLNDENNPIIFGYGDDNSSEYREILESLKNDMLVNFKTFKYLKNDNYKKTLGLLEEDKEIYCTILGHSCVMTDKTLLREIFQHKNVKSIQYVYYDNEQNYYKNLYAMARIFDENQMMRKKVLSQHKTRKI